MQALYIHSLQIALGFERVASLAKPPPA